MKEPFSAAGINSTLGRLGQFWLPRYNLAAIVDLYFHYKDYLANHFPSPTLELDYIKSSKNFCI